ncbi:MAG: SusC/RagA family TonB-linked outer membrane protein, partial [Bacteroidales bacterium]|nr:SusC/RagA family TonB-linked outer membrane protein [Bacteroidales bacterium]
MKKIGTILTFLFCLATVQLYGQTIQVKGVVTDAMDNSTLPGVVITVKGTNTVVSTLNDGSYTVSAQANSVLVFSFIGMTPQEVAVQGREVINVVLSSSTVLDEVVVTALGITRERKSLGYAVQAVDGEEFSKIRTGNVVNSLAGRVAGVQIVSSSGQLGGGAKVTVRGNTSLTGSNDPLFVVDGVPMVNYDYSTTNGISSGYNMGNLGSDISPDDIENMSILKGASATAMYGSRGANGVILITTKKGKLGSRSLGVSVNSSVTFDKVGIIPEYQKVYGGGDGPMQVITINGRQYNYPNLDVDESWGPKYDPSLMALSWNSFDEWDTANYLKERPWVYPKNDYTTYFKTGVGINNNIAITGTSENHSFRLSYTNLDQTSIFENAKLKRNNVAFNSTSKINRFMESFFTANYVHTDALGRPETGYGDNNTSKTMFQWTQTQLDYKELKEYKNPDGTQRTWNRRDWNNPHPLYADNPFWSVYENYESDVRNRFFGSGGVIINLADGLKLTGRAGIDAFSYTQELRSAMGSCALSFYEIVTRINTETSGDLFLNYNKRLADNKIGVSAMAGASIANRRYQLMNGWTQSGLVIPGVYNLANSVGMARINESKTWKRTNSVFGSVTFDWNMMVYLDVTARNDWSSALPSDHRSYFYPSVNLSFILSQIEGLKDIQWLSFAKLRGGYAEVGNDTNPYRLQTYYEFQTPFGSMTRFHLPTQLQNPNLRPERTKSWEIGLEAHLFNNRLGLDVAYYEKRTFDQIVSSAVSNATGYASMVINTGEVYNSGLELTVNASPIRTRNGLNWDMQFNLATLNNKVISIAEGISWLNLSSNGFSLFTGAHEGETYPVIYGKDYVYGENGEKLIDPATGRYRRTTDNVPLGKVTPDFTAGLSNSFSYKGFDLFVLFDMQMGGHMHYMSHMWGMYSGMLWETAQPTNVPGKSGDVREDGWIYPGVYGREVWNAQQERYITQYQNAAGTVVTSPEDNTRAVVDYNYGSHFYYGPNSLSVFKTDFIKLRELRIGYTFPKTFTGPIKDLRVSFFGRNLATFMAAQKHFDPEY